MVLWLAACAAPPSEPLPLEIGRAASVTEEVPQDTQSAQETTPPKTPVVTTDAEDIVVSRPDASIVVSADNVSETADDMVAEAPDTAPEIVTTDTVAEAPKDMAGDNTTPKEELGSSLPTVTFPAPISPDVVLSEDTDRAESKSSELQTEIAALLESRNESQDVQLASEAPIISQEAEGLSSNTLLGKEALDAAFSLLATRAVKNVDTLDLLPPRVDGEFRIGVMLPFTGPYAALGADIASGAELALFQLKLPALNLIYIDTAAGDNAIEAQEIARNADLDLIIGPLFSDSISTVQPLLSELSIPALTLTNNQDMATPNSWVLGYIPEQQIDLLLSQSIEAGRNKIAVLAADDVFGQRVLQHTTDRLGDFGLQPAEIMILGPDRLNEEANLREAIKQFSRYREPENDDTLVLSPAPYDSLILAGLPRFLLRVAPVLDYYDLGPDRVHYLGTDLWDRPELLTEPSLQDSYIAVAKQPDDTAFRNLWFQAFDLEPSNFAKLGFDVLAVAGALQPQIDSPENWPKYLARKQGFSGFTGSFRLLPDGTNVRNFEVKQLVDYALQDTIE